MWPPVRPMMRFSIKKWLSPFPGNGSFGVTIVQEAQRRELALLLHHGYVKPHIFGKPKGRLWNEPQKHLPGPTNNELIFLESSTFSSPAVPKISSSLEYIRKNFLSKANWGSFQSYTIKVSHAGCFTRLRNVLFFGGCAPFVLDDLIQLFIQGHFGILCLDFELCNSFIIIWRSIVPSFI